MGHPAESVEFWAVCDLYGERDAAVRRYGYRDRDLLRWQHGPEDGGSEWRRGKVHNLDADLGRAQYFGDIQRQRQLYRQFGFADTDGELGDRTRVLRPKRTGPWNPTPSTPLRAGSSAKCAQGLGTRQRGLFEGESHNGRNSTISTEGITPAPHLHLNFVTITHSVHSHDTRRGWAISSIAHLRVCQLLRNRILFKRDLRLR